MSRRGGRSGVFPGRSSRVSNYDDGASSQYYDDSRYGDDSRYDGDGRTYYDDDDAGSSYFEDAEGWESDASDGGWYKPPELEVAEAHAEETNPQHRGIQRAFAFEPVDVKQYGVGVVLYFTFMRFLSRAFLALSVLSIPTILLHVAGDHYEPKEDPVAEIIERSSLGNYGELYRWEMGGLAPDGNGTAAPVGDAPPAPDAWAADQATTSHDPWVHGASNTVTYFFASQEKDALLIGLSYFNLAFLAVFAFFAFSIGPTQDKIVAEVDRNLTTIEDYSIVARDIPDDVHDPMELWKHFEKRIGKVQDVQVAHNTSELLGLALERERKARDFDVAKAKWRKNKEDPDVKDEKVRKMEEDALEKKRDLHATDAAIRALQNDRMGEPQVSILAYVTFQDEESFLRCLKEYRPGFFAWLFRPKRLRVRETHRLVVKQAPPPADIKWENLQFGYWERQFRQFNIGLVAGVVLAAAFVGIAGVTTLEQGTSTEYDQIACRAACAYGVEPITLENEALRDVYKTCFDESQIVAPPPAPPPPAWQRRRAMLGEEGDEGEDGDGGVGDRGDEEEAVVVEEEVRFSDDDDEGERRFLFSSSSFVVARGLLQESSSSSEDLAARQATAAAAYNGTCGPNDSFCYACYCLEHITASSVFNERSYCEPYVYGFTMQLVAGGAAQGIILVLNIVLNPLLIWLVRYEKHHSNSGEQRSLMTKLFVSQFFNTAINLILIAGSFPWLKDYFKGTIADGLLFQGDVEDLTPRWYEEVGVPIAMTIIATPLSARAATAIRYVSFKYTRFTAPNHAVTQDQLNRAFEGPDFDLSTRYGEVLNILFLTMTFGAGMPLLVPLAAFAFNSAYAVDKFDFARVSRVPPWYSTALGEGAAEIVAYAAVGHLLFAVWANSYYRVDPDPLVTGLIGGALEGFASFWKALPEPIDTLFGAVPDASEVARRALQKNTAFYTLTLFVLLVVLVFRSVRELARAALAEVAPQRFAKGARTAEGNPPFDLAVQGEQLVGATTYSIKHTPQYEAAFRKVVWEADDGVL